MGRGGKVEQKSWEERERRGLTGKRRWKQDGAKAHGLEELQVENHWSIFRHSLKKKKERKNLTDFQR